LPALLELSMVKRTFTDQRDAALRTPLVQTRCAGTMRRFLTAFRTEAEPAGAESLTL
jgi:hypothetical protein